MIVHAHATETLKLLTESNSRSLAVEVSDDNGTDQQPTLAEHIAQAQHILGVGNTEVAANLIALDILG